MFTSFQTWLEGKQAATDAERAYRLTKSQIKHLRKLDLSYVQSLFHAFVKNYGMPATQETVDGIKRAVEERFAGDGTEYEFPDDKSYFAWKDMTPVTLGFNSVQ